MAEELTFKDEAAAEYDRAFAHVTAHFLRTKRRQLRTLLALPPPLHRNHRSLLPPTPSAPEPPFEVENLGGGAQSDLERRLGRQQRDRRRNRSWRSHYLRCGIVAAAVADRVAARLS
jgi:hypothetical protein